MCELILNMVEESKDIGRRVVARKVRVPSRRDSDGLWRDIENYIVEDYGFPLCHKLAGCVKIVVGDFEDAARFVASDRKIKL